jgi:UDP-GlcNAc:undecaprenyl-phosphate GlcNAc-1-phosphate transferase
VLAGLVASSPTVASASLVSVLFVPLAIVAVPLLDTTLVTVTRVLAGRPIYEGGLDHSTYRLIALGLSERQVAVLLYGFAAGGGIVAMGLTRLDSGLGYLLGTAFLVAMSLLAAYLGHIKVSAPAQVRRMKPVTVLVRSLFYRRRLAEILLDASLITVAYYGAYRLRFDGALPPEYAAAFQGTVGLMIAVTVVTLGLFGVYRGAWEYAGIFDVYRIVGALTLSAGGLLAYGEWRVPTLAQSHSLVYVDALLAMALLLAARLSFKSLETLRQRLQLRGDRVLIYGADDGGELTLRELLNHSELRLRPVCFVDDDSRRHGTNIHGVPIVAGFDGIAWAVSRYRVDKIVIGSRKLAPETISLIQALAQGLDLGVAQVSFGVKWLVPGSTAAAAAVAASSAAPRMLAVEGNSIGPEAGAAVMARMAMRPDDSTLTDLQAAG